MTEPSYILLYVDDPETSGRFYSGVLDAQPVESSPTFVLFAFPGGRKLGLWSRHTVEPAPGAAGGGAEVGIPLATGAEVDAAHAAWRGRGVAILQPPTDMDFGRSFVATDPDGHRLRVFALSEAA